MAFGQASGPPATAREVQILLELLQRAGHDDFRDARGPMGFNQRQAAGKFTRTEAAELIERLEAAAEVGATAEPIAPAPSLSRAEQAIRALPTDQLAAELQRRGWVVMEP